MLDPIDQADSVAGRGFSWLLANVEQLAPAGALRRWAHADRARVAVAELAILAQIARRMPGPAAPARGGELARRIQAVACPDLLGQFQRDPPAWFRPLLATAGALRAAGQPWDEGLAAVRAYLGGAREDLSAYRPDQVLEMRYWVHACGLLPVSFYDGLAGAVPPIVDALARQLVAAPGLEIEAAYALMHIVFYLRDFGAGAFQLPGAHGAARQIVRSALAAGNTDVLAEAVFTCWCLQIDPGVDLGAAVAVFAGAQRESGAVAPSLRPAATQPAGAEVEACYHSTIVALLACMAIGRCRGLAAGGAHGRAA